MVVVVEGAGGVVGAVVAAVAGAGVGCEACVAAVVVVRVSSVGGVFLVQPAVERDAAGVGGRCGGRGLIVD
jgi:hypothetical protein